MDSASINDDDNKSVTSSVISNRPRTSSTAQKPGSSGAAADGGALIPYVEALNLEQRLHTEVQELTFDQIIVKSRLSNRDPNKQRDMVVQEFNKHIKEPVIINAGARAGERVEPGYFLVAHKNKQCEIRAGVGDRYALHLVTGYTETGYVGSKDGKFRQNDPLIGDYGTFLVNVAQGKLAKVWIGNTPLILGEGPHIFHDPLFKAAAPMLVNDSDPQISHGNIHVIRVPAAHLAKVTIDTKNYLLPYRRDPYVFDTSLFQFHAFVSENTGYVDHAPLHLVRVPAGTIAKVWLGSKALLLEYREEPYFFDDPLFKIERNSDEEFRRQRARLNEENARCFTDANTKLIRHGTIYRLRPGVDGDLERAVLQHDGELQFVDRFTTIDSAQSAVLGFINMGIQTCVFPSKETKAERRRENQHATQEEIQYEPMTTKDSLKIGMKLLVAFQVKDPHVTLSKLRLQDIHPHVENLAVSDMVRAVQHATSQNFVNAVSSKDSPDDETASDHIADKVREELKRHLADCGLNLVRFNIEEAKVLDAEISREMSKQSLVAATANAQQAVIEQKANIARSQAEVAAMERRVQQEQENRIKIEAARADLEAAKLRADATVVQAKADQTAAELMGEQFKKFPELLQLKLAELQFGALQSSRVNIVSNDIASSPFVFGAQGLMSSMEVTKQHRGE